MRYDKAMDRLLRDDLEVARKTTPEERARQALDLMQAGFRLKMASLRTRYPSDSEGQIEARFRSWLERDDRA